ncbi:hypothetical protein NQ314_012664 [Rhamnusium bicolor]|uniref:CHK kinase-like domain-containing protein n=1 Tax=Rhamnusium bicolor TaxID=1586634 RepID=A0AAV8XAX1_9CUCU|nr:hypothetical protein NQ314_012664 [Rhamnusium bicolor]
MTSQGDSMGFRFTILHGDLWGNNFLYHYGNENSEITDCKLIDFQTVKYGPPALDVLQFILTNTRKSFRDKHQNELLTYYYNYFSSLLTERGFKAPEILTESEFKKSCDVFILPAKIQAVVDRSITFMPDETFIEAAKTEESFHKFLYEERGKYIVTFFNKKSIFQRVNDRGYK